EQSVLCTQDIPGSPPGFHEATSLPEPVAHIELGGGGRLCALCADARDEVHLLHRDVPMGAEEHVEVVRSAPHVVFVAAVGAGVHPLVSEGTARFAGAGVGW